YTPLAEVQRWGGLPRGTPLFETLFVFENYPVDRALGDRESALRAVGLEASDVRVSERTNYPLTAIVGPGPELVLRLAYETRRLDAAAAARSLDRWAALLEAVAADPDRPLGELPLSTEADRRRVLDGWAAGPAGPVPDQCVHELFAMRAAQHPDAIAVECGPDRLTYRDLDRRANRFANRLRRLGVGPD